MLGSLVLSNRWWCTKYILIIQYDIHLDNKKKYYYGHVIIQIKCVYASD